MIPVAHGYPAGHTAGDHMHMHLRNNRPLHTHEVPRPADAFPIPVYFFVFDTPGVLHT